MTDAYPHHNVSPSGPIEDAFAITPHDTNALSHVTRSLWVGVAGDIKVTTRKGNEVTYKNMTVGRHPIRVTHVHATDTTASEIVGEY